MSPYFVKRGEVHAGEHVYRVGDVLPEGVGDEAMLEAGAVELVPEDVPATKQQPRRKRT